MSDQSPSKGRDSRLALSGWPLRRKVALALAVPLLLAATFGGLRVKSDLDESNNSAASAKQVTILQPAIGYLTAAEKGMVAAQSSVGTSQAELDDALVELKAAGVELEKTRDKANLTFDQRRQVDVILDLSSALRAEGDDPVSAGTWIAQLRQMQSGVTTLISTIINAQNTPEPRLDLLSQTLGGRFALAQQQALTAGGGTGKSVQTALYAEFGAERTALDRLAGQDGVKDGSVQTLRTNNGQRATNSDGGGDLGGADAYDEYDNLQAGLIDAVDAQLTKAAANARGGALLNALLTLLALAAAIALAVIISRSLVNPIRRVREGALQVAQRDLPDAVNRIRAGADPGPIKRIDVHTHEEVGQLARAVDDLHQQAVTLASGEAQLRSQVGEMFVTLSRRNTTLINQQLNLIEALESDEEDPKRLESLFRLDHLASRMRRTADSLLILADAPTRSAGWESVSIAETLQAATAGVTDYQRVRVESALGTKVNEEAAGDLVHLVTELVDNSLSYSSPNTTVVLASTSGDNGVTITVADAGLGIPADELQVINENLSTGVEVTPDTARRMGLFVVSRLAQRHGIRVSLKANRGDGMTAYIFVPNAILPERAGLELVPEAAEEAEVEESTVEESTVEESAAVVPINVVPLSVVPTDTDEDDSDEDRSDEDDTDEDSSDEPAVDESDPLGLGDQKVEPPAGLGLPTRERGATLSNLTAAGVRLPTKDADGNEEVAETREMKRPTAAMPLRSKRNLETAAPAVSAVPDIAQDSEPEESKTVESEVSEVQEPEVQEPEVQEPEVQEPEVQEPEASEVEEPEASEVEEPEAPEEIEVQEPEAEEAADDVPDVFYTPSALDEPAAFLDDDPDHSDGSEAVAQTSTPFDDFDPAPAVSPAAMVETRDQPLTIEEPVARADAASANISALMAKIRPQRGRLPIPDYEEVDHAEILRGSSRDGSTADAPAASAPDTASPVSAPQPAYASEPAAAVTSLAPESLVPAGTVAADATVPHSTEGRRDEESSINGAMKSSWLSSDEQDQSWSSSSSEVEAGWQRTNTVAEMHSEPISDAGLPVRQPGARLVPGSVSKPVGAGGRDPEAIRARLSAHKAGVRRGRTSPVSADDQ